MVQTPLQQTARALRVFAIAALVAPLPALAQRVWDGDSSGVWSDPANWDGDAAVPAPGLTNIHFGAAKHYTISDRPGSTAKYQEVNFGTWTFLASAGKNYTISGGNGPANVTVEYSPRAANHTIENRLRLVGRTLDVRDPRTSLTLNEADWAGNVVKAGDGTLIVTNSGANPGLITVSAGVLDLRANQGMSNGALRFSGSNPEAVIINSTGAVHTLGLGATAEHETVVTFAGSIAGNLAVRNGQPHVASGAVQVLAGNNSYRGTTTIHSGSLIVNGTHIGGGDYQVASRTNAPGHGVLGGSGMIELADNERVFNFAGNASDRLAILRPGESDADTAAFTLGSALVPTAVNLNAFSQLQVDVGAASASDSVTIFGSLFIDPKSTLSVAALSGAWDGSAYTLVTASAGLTGTFGSVMGVPAGYRVHYAPGAIKLVPVR